MQKPSESTMRRVSENMRAFVTDAAIHRSAIHQFAIGAVIRDPVIVSNEYLEYWGDFFVENRFAARGILFETFMFDPFAISQAVLFGGRLRDPEDFLPLLPRQREVARQVHPHVPAISKPLPPGRITDVWVDEALDLPIFLRKQAD